MKKVLLSWSSGKDSAWALHLLRQQPDVQVAALFTTFNAAADRVAMHAVRRDLVQRQAEAAGLPLWTVDLPWPCSNLEYESRLAAVLTRARQERFDAIAFGDLFLTDIRAYREKQLDGTGLEPLFPVWGIPTAQLSRDMIAAGVKARLTCIDSSKLDSHFAGRDWNTDLLEALPQDIDPCGENGEFHTFVSESPAFSHPIAVRTGDLVERDGFVFADLLQVNTPNSGTLLHSALPAHRSPIRNTSDDLQTPKHPQRQSLQTHHLNWSKPMSHPLTTPEIHPDHPPVVPIPQDPFMPKGPLQRLVNLFPGGQFFRYLLVGGFNTLFGYGSFLVILKLLATVIPVRFLSLTAIAASVISTPLNITVAYFGYKFFVFKTQGNYLLEWLKCFAVYGTGMIPGLVALGFLTRLLQSAIHTHAASLHRLLAATESHLGGAPLHVVQSIAHGKTLAASIAGALVIAVSTIYSFVGHKKVTFKTTSPASTPDAA